MKIFRLMLIALATLAFVACELGDDGSSNIKNPNRLPNEELNGNPSEGNNNGNK